MLVLKLSGKNTNTINSESNFSKSKICHIPFRNQYNLSKNLPVPSIVVQKTIWNILYVFTKIIFGIIVMGILKCMY